MAMWVHVLLMGQDKYFLHQPDQPRCIDAFICCIKPQLVQMERRHLSWQRGAQKVAPELIGCLLLKRQAGGALLGGVIVELEPSPGGAS